MITWEIAWRLVYERGLRLPVDRPCEDARLEQVIKRLHELEEEQLKLLQEIAEKGKQILSEVE